MNLMMIRADVQREHVADVEAAAQKMFAAIDEASPDGVRYVQGQRRQHVRSDPRP